MRTINNFGTKGDLPSHPQLLDWLATELIESGWSQKHIHRLILTSQTYQQSSIHPREFEYAEKDFGNKLLWKMNRKRLDAEALRDSMLIASGFLDRKIGGKSFRPKISSEALEGLSRKQSAWTESPENELSRRSIYVFSKRSLISPLLTVFDFCDTTKPCGKREESIVAPQALALLNNEFTHSQSHKMARRIERLSSDSKMQIELAWKFAIGRKPGRDEFAFSLEHLKSQLDRFRTKTDKPQRSIPKESESAPVILIRNDSILWLDASKEVETKDGKVVLWKDQSEKSNHASMSETGKQPIVAKNSINGMNGIRFDGKDDFLNLSKPLLTSQQFSIFAVANDRIENGVREILSNWNRDGNSVTSIFFGLTGKNRIRLSDNFANVGVVPNREKGFVLAGIAGPTATRILVNGSEVASKGELSNRRLDRPWVIGTQGNFGHEFWKGDIAEVIVFDRALDVREIESVNDYLLRRYSIKRVVTSDHRSSPAQLALESLCHVLLNTNEFIYID